MADDRLLSRRGWALVVALLVGAYIVWISIPATRQVEGSWVTDFSDRRKLVGYADAVFVGRVIERTEEVADLRWPSTRFRVEVLEVIKSTRRLDPSKLDSEPSRQISLPSSVIVDQYGGYTRDLSGKLVKVVFDGQELLEPGRTYVLATSMMPIAAGTTSCRWALCRRTMPRLATRQWIASDVLPPSRYRMRPVLPTRLVSLWPQDALR
ncbi:hypothetical protein Tter_1935 [Thermobaculum terrenum ATCC BAA-798]|uniref:Uncharacterized protein n=1 Tax=Thermobaculum terrenum (strain ATCC BAA-798 / CCMEE 7001 / YNP1) TaxID=525904 RepID=D1CGH0_THET1|nr:hypothetical protein [Thermobaculum terrenum]ACZ42841.1 hypothetical protein Tter_1935 [Thermobaculum terrenum ATCC BAA-798]